MFALFLNSQPQSKDGSEPLYPEPLLLISSDRSSPGQDVQRFLSTGSDIVVGTPGRIEEFLLGKGRYSVNVKELEVLIMDEADRSIYPPAFLCDFFLIQSFPKASGFRVSRHSNENHHPSA